MELLIVDLEPELLEPLKTTGSDLLVNPELLVSDPPKLLN